MSPSRFLLPISLLAAGCGGGGDHCGPEGAPGVGLVASGTTTSTTLTFGGLHAGANGDCPAAEGGVTSLTITGAQTGGTGFVTLCVPRPDLLATQAQTLSLERASGQAYVIDVAGTTDTCSYTIDRALPASGSVSATGMCGDGIDPAGFALVVEGALTLKRTCGATVDSVAVTLRGRVAVVPE